MRKDIFYSKGDKKYLYVGIYFIILELVFITSLFWTKDYTGIMWSCNLVPIIFAFSFLTKNFRLIKGTLNYIFIPHLVFVIVSLIYFSTGLNLINIQLGYTSFSVGFRAILFHLFSANVALFYSYKIKSDKKSIIYSAIIFLIIYILTILLTPPALNINFLSSSKVIIGVDVPFLKLIWPFFVFTIFVVPTYFFQKYLFKISTRKY